MHAEEECLTSCRGYTRNTCSCQSILEINFSFVFEAEKSLEASSSLQETKSRSSSCVLLMQDTSREEFLTIQPGKVDTEYNTYMAHFFLENEQEEESVDREEEEKLP